MNPDVTILYDSIRWEEKALLEAGKKKDINIQMVDCKKLALDLEKKPEDYGVVIQRCVSYYRNLHSTAALEGMGVKVINCLNTGVFAGNKLFTHMLLKKIRCSNTRCNSSIFKRCSYSSIRNRWISKSHKTNSWQLGQVNFKTK